MASPTVKVIKVCFATKHFEYQNSAPFEILACNEQRGGCNLHGTKECSADGRCVCKPGYMDDNCQYCIPSSLIVSGNNGSILNQTGYGVKCSK